jgi:hypothetical protein
VIVRLQRDRKCKRLGINETGNSVIIWSTFEATELFRKNRL